MAIVNLTKAGIKVLPLNSGIWRDQQVKGLMVVCHKTTKTFSVQGDVRRNGRHIRTVRVKIDRCDRMSLLEARRKAKELMSLIQSGVDPTATPDESGITLVQVLDNYAEGRNLASRTLQEYEYHLKKYLKPFRKRAVADISRVEVRDVFNSLKHRSGVTTASSVMRTLRALINEARRFDETIGQNPVSAIRIPPNRRREVGELDIREWWKRTEKLTPIRRDVHRFFMFSGLRRRSLVTIRRQDVNLEKGIIEVQQMKSRRTFILPLSDFMSDLISNRMRADEPIQSEWLWFSATSASGHVTEPKEKGFPSPHVYRHLWRTQAIEAGVPYAESALLLDQRLPGASGGYVHQNHLADHLRQYQQAVTEHLLKLI